MAGKKKDRQKTWCLLLKTYFAVKMGATRQTCQLCLSETELIVPVSGNYCRKTNMLEKIFECLQLRLKDDYGTFICYECATNIEKYHNFINRIREAQTKMIPVKNSQKQEVTKHSMNRVTSYVREQVFDADYTFSFLADDEPKPKLSSPLFSFFSPSNVLKDSLKVNLSQKKPEETKRAPEWYRKEKRPRLTNNSRDIFDSQSQDIEGEPPKSFDWKLTPDDNIIKRVKENFFGQMGF